MSEWTSTAEEAAHVEKLRSELERNTAVSVVLKNGVEHVGRILTARVNARPSEADPEAWSYTGSATLVTQNEVEIDLDVLDIAAISECPEMDEVMAAVWRARDYPERPL